MSFTICTFKHNPLITNIESSKVQVQLELRQCCILNKCEILRLVQCELELLCLNFMINMLSFQLTKHPTILCLFVRNIISTACVRNLVCVILRETQHTPKQVCPRRKFRTIKDQFSHPLVLIPLVMSRTFLPCIGQ